MSRNVLGGITSLSGTAGSCGSGACRIASSTFSDNGVCAIELQSTDGGAVSGCTISGTNIGLHVGDVSGSGCARGVSVTDCTLSDCPTGIVAISGGRTLVIRNHVIGAGTPYSVAAGNLVGPVLTTSADLATIANPHANYAQ